MADPVDPINESILDSTKKLVNVPADYDVFDLDIMMHINSVFFTLHQLGVGPPNGYMITSSADTWGAFIGPDQIQAVRSYMSLKVRLLFDPPATSFVVKAFEDQAKEFEWRLNLHMEGVRHPWAPSSTPSP